MRRRSTQETDFLPKGSSSSDSRATSTMIRLRLSGSTSTGNSFPVAVRIARRSGLLKDIRVTASHPAPPFGSITETVMSQVPPGALLGPTSCAANTFAVVGTSPSAAAAPESASSACCGVRPLTSAGEDSA